MESSAVAVYVMAMIMDVVLISRKYPSAMKRFIYLLISTLGLGVVSCQPEDMYGCPPPADRGDEGMYHTSNRVLDVEDDSNKNE